MAESRRSENCWSRISGALQRSSALGDEITRMINFRLRVHPTTDTEVGGRTRVAERLSRLLNPTLCTRSPLNGVWLWLAVFLAVGVFEASPAFSQSINGSILEPRFVSPSSGRTIRFNIYLPAAYEDGKDRYAVIYHLHSVDRTRSTNNRLIASEVERALEAAVLPPVIVVFPDGEKDSYWTGSKSGGTIVETRVIRELIPYIDANYRTKATRRFRAIQSVSMGDRAAVVYGLAFPELFSVSVSYEEAPYPRASLSGSRREIATEMVSLDEAYFNRYSPWFDAGNYFAKIRDYPVVSRMVVRQNYPPNQGLKQRLNGLEIPASYEQTSCTLSNLQSDLRCLSDEAGLERYRFIGRHLGE